MDDGNCSHMSRLRIMYCFFVGLGFGEGQQHLDFAPALGGHQRDRRQGRGTD